MKIQDYISAELAKDQFKTYDSLFWEFFGLEKKSGFLFNFNRQIGYVALVYNFRKVTGTKARGLGSVSELTAERIQTAMKELEQIEMERLKQEIKILEAVARKLNPTTSKPVEPVQKIVAQKKYKAMVKVSQDADYVPTTLAESETQIKDLIVSSIENVSYSIVEKLVNDGKNVIENFLSEYNSQVQQLKVKIGEREFAYHDIDVPELKVLTLEQWFDLNN